MQASGTGFQRAQHDAVAGQNDTAQECAVGINGFNGDGGTHHHHHARLVCLTACQQALAGTDDGHPAVGP